MDATTRASQEDISSFSSPSQKGNVADSSSREKKILQGRRQQRHSTEIGSEYHRWWVVRNALGFETNEHIAGLLLDGFHGLLQQLVVMCGGDTYQPGIHSEAKMPCESNDNCEDLAQSPSSSSSASPPGGIENMDEFMEYKNAITYYCDSLWRICCQQGSQLQQLDKTSQPVQEFLIRLMGYLRAAKGKSFSVNPKKKRFKPSNMCIRNVGEGNSCQVSSAKVCPPASVAHHESECSSALSISKQTVTQDMTRVCTDDLQLGWADKYKSSSIDSNKDLVTEVGENIEKSPTMQTRSRENIDRGSKPVKNTTTDRCSYDGQNSSSHFPAQHLPVKTEQNGQTHLKQEKVIHPHFVHSQSEIHHQAEMQETSLSNRPSQQLPEVTQPLNLLPLQRQTPNPQQHSGHVHEMDQEQWKHSKQNDTSHQKMEACSEVGYQQQEQTAKDKQQQKQFSLDQQKSKENEQTHSVAEKTSSHWWKHVEESCMYPGISSRKDVRDMGPVIGCSVNMCGNNSTSDATGTDEKSDGELGFLLTDPLKMLPCIDEEINDLPQSQQHSSDKRRCANVKRLTNQNDFKPSSVSTAAPSRQAQGCQTNVSMVIPNGQLAASGVVTNRAQSLLPNMNIPKQKAKETQTMGTNTTFYNEIKINLNNPRCVGELKSQKVAGSPFPQPIQPALFSGVDKPSSVTASLGTPVILYPASSFSSNDNSLASLSSLVHNIVYNSYGTILKPLSLTSLASSVSYNTPHQLIPPLSVSTVDSSSQRKPIAAALPVLSSQLNAGKPTLVPFYISHTAVNTLSNINHTAVNTLGNFSKCTNLSGLPSSIQNLSGSQATTQSCFQNHQQSAGQGFTSTSLLHDSSFSGQTVYSDLSSPMNQMKISDIQSQSGPEFSSNGQVRGETLVSQISSSSPIIVQEMDKKEMKSNNSACFAQNASVTYSGRGHQSINDQQLDSFVKQSSYASVKPTMTTATYVCDQSENSTQSSDNKCLSGSQPECPEKTCGTSRPLAQFEQQVQAAKSTSKILNSLLASREVAYNNAIYGSSQINKRKMSLNSLETTLKASQLSDSKSNIPLNNGNVVFLSQNDSKLQRSEEGNISQQKNLVADLQCTLDSRSASVTSSWSHKSASRRRLVCPVCNVHFFSSMDLLVHRFELHGHVCSECDSRFLTLTRLKQHKEADHPSILMCPQCRFHTFRREDLADHLLSVHGVTVNDIDPGKDDTQRCDHTDKSQGTREIIFDSLHPGIPQQKLKTECPTKKSDVTKDDVCPAESENSSKKPSSFTRTREPISAAKKTGRISLEASVGVDSCTKELSNREKCQDNPQRKVTVIDSGLTKQTTGAHAEEASSGPVFPSFSREVSGTARADLDMISAMYAQVSQHCQLDATDYLNMSDLHLSESEEPRLVIDTDVSCSKDSCKNSCGQLDENILQVNEPRKHAASFLHSKSKNNGGKVCSSSSHIGKSSRKLMSPGKNISSCSYSLNESEALSGASLGKRFLNKEADKCLQEETKVMNLTASKGRDRERLIMNIKRRNSTPAFNSHSRRKKRARSNKNCGVDLRTDAAVVEIDKPVMENDDEGYYISKSSLNKNQNCCCNLSVTSSDQVSSTADNTVTYDSSSRVGFYQMIVPTRDCYLQTDESIKTSLECLDNTDCAKKQSGHEQDINNHSEIKSSEQFDAVKDDCGDLKAPIRPENILSLRERHAMSSLPPKKRKLKKSPRANKDSSSTNEVHCNSQSVNDDVFKTHDPVADISETNSLIDTTIQVSKTADKRNKTSLVINQKLSAEFTDIPDSQEKHISDSTADFGNKVESELTKQEPQFARHGQLLQLGGGHREGPVSSCKVTFCRRWNMKDHMTKTHVKSSVIGCSVAGCDVKFANRRELRQHITVDHMGKTRKYMCSWPDCSKGFFARTHLSIHMLTHTGEKPVACDICDYRCRQRTALIWHLRKHGVFHKTGKVKNRRSTVTL